MVLPCKEKKKKKKEKKKEKEKEMKKATKGKEKNAKKRQSPVGKDDSIACEASIVEYWLSEDSAKWFKPVLCQLGQPSCALLCLALLSTDGSKPFLPHGAVVVRGCAHPVPLLLRFQNAGPLKYLGIVSRRPRVHLIVTANTHLPPRLARVTLAVKEKGIRSHEPNMLISCMQEGIKRRVMLIVRCVRVECRHQGQFMGLCPRLGIVSMHMRFRAPVDTSVCLIRSNRCFVAAGCPSGTFRDSGLLTHTHTHNL
eukprot:1688705-Amphidinium_carterae.1